MVIAAEVAKVVGKMQADFDGDALAYMQACYRGEIKPDPLRMSAAAAALKFERPALAAKLQATVDARTPLTRDQLTAFCTFSPAAIFFRSAAASGQSCISDKGYDLSLSTEDDDLPVPKRWRAKSMNLPIRLPSEDIRAATGCQHKTRICFAS
jgi:hypothetical protein